MSTTLNTAIRTAALAFVNARNASRAHFDGHQAAVRSIPVPRGADGIEAINAYAAECGMAASAAGYTAAAGAELHRAMLAARENLLRAAAPLLRRPEFRAIRNADPATAADAIVRACN